MAISTLLATRPCVPRLYPRTSLGVTAAINVPLNRRLAVATPASSEAAETWRAFAEPWVRANHVRTAGGLLASASFTLSGIAT